MDGFGLQSICIAYKEFPAGLFFQSNIFIGFIQNYMLGTGVLFQEHKLHFSF